MGETKTNIFFSDKKLHSEVYEKILDDASKANLKPGSKLPSIQKLAKRYQVSETPVRQAVQNLIKDGFAESLRRKGIFLKKLPEALSHSQNKTRNDNAEINYALPFSTPHIQSRIELRLELVDSLPIQQAMWRGITSRFKKKHKNIEIATSFRSKDKNNFPADIIQLGSRQMYDRILDGKLQSIPSSMFPLKKFPKTSLLPAMHKKSLYGIPLNVNLPVSLVNLNILKKLSLDLSPQNFSFAAFVNACDALKKVQENSLIEKDVLPLASQVNPFLYLTAFSSSFFDDKKKTFDWQHPSVIEFFKKISFVVRPREEIGVSWKELLNKFSKGKALFVSSYSICLDKIPSFARILPFPREKNGILLYGSNYHTISSQSEKLIESIKFLQFLASEEIKSFVNEQGYTHILGGKENDSSPMEEIEAREFKNSHPDLMCGVNNYDFIVKHFWSVIDHVRENSLSPADAVNILSQSYENNMTGEAQ